MQAAVGNSAGHQVYLAVVAGHDDGKWERAWERMSLVHASVHLLKIGYHTHDSSIAYDATYHYGLSVCIPTWQSSSYNNRK